MITKEVALIRLKDSGSLPTLPEVLLQLLAACEDETPLREIGVLVGQDPTLSLRVMQLVNSAYYGFRHSFNKIEQAVVYLGAKTVKNLAVTLSVQQVFDDRKNPGCIDMQSFWFHSFLCGTLAKRIAVKLGFDSGEEAYLAGLMHDIGKLLLSRAFPDEWHSIEAENLAFHTRLAEETRRMGVHHAEAAAHLVEQWRLNPLIADAILYHHETSRQAAEAFPLVKTVYLANLLALAEDPAVAPGDHAAVAELFFGFEDEDLRSIREGAIEEVEQIAGLLKLNLTRPAHVAVAAGDNDKAAPEQQPAAATEHGRSPLLSLEGKLGGRIKDISLVTTFLEDFIRAGSVNDMLRVFEEAMHLLFGIDSTLFFLPDREAIFLSADSSTDNPLHDYCRGLNFSLKNSSSIVSFAYREKKRQAVHRDRDAGNIADQQLLSVLGCSAALCVPLTAENSCMGVAVVSLMKDAEEGLRENGKVLKALTGQLALCLHLDAVNAQRAEDLQAERMAAIATTAKKFAHEINNPLGIISNYLMTMRLKLAGNAEVLEELTIVEDEIQRIATMIGEMEMYSQAPFTRFESTDINEVVKDVIRLARPSLFDKTGLVLSFIPGSDLPHLETSKDAIKQILINLLKNSAEAMGENGRVVVRTRKIGGFSEDSLKAVEIILADTGPGLPENVLAHLYEPFVTTKTDGHSGLGLSIVKKAVQQIGGNLTCVSSESQGTTFTILVRDVHASVPA